MVKEEDGVWCVGDMAGKAVWEAGVEGFWSDEIRGNVCVCGER